LGIKETNFGLVRTLMVGVKSKTHQDLKGEVWFNELRIADMDNQRMAAILSVDSNLADFATISATGKSTIFRCLGTGTKPKKP
jgi:cell surface protein SprA